MAQFNSYTINVINSSGAQQHYALFSKPPVVNGKAGKFTIFNQYYATVGASERSMAHGVAISVAREKAIKLGTTSPSGEKVPGSSLALKIDDGAPQFDTHYLPDGGFVNAFEIKTGTDFTIAEAKHGNYVIGIGTSTNGSTSGGPIASFQPEPNVSYQIQPVLTYYLTFGDYQQSTIIDYTKIGAQVAVDFTELEPNVTIIHDAHGNVNIQR